MSPEPPDANDDDSPDGSQKNSTVLDFGGYNTRAWPFALYICLAVLTGGLLWILAQISPRTLLWTMVKCPLSHARYVQAKLINGQVTLVKVHTYHVEASPFHMSQTVNMREMGRHVQRTITIQLAVYVFDCMADTYKPRPNMPKDLPVQIHNARQALQLIDNGAPWQVFNTSGSWPRKARAQLYGYNDMATGRPRIVSMAAGLLVYPVYVNQYVELAFTIYEGYVLYAAILLFITLMSGFAATKMQYMKRMSLYTSVQQCHLVPIVSAGYVRAVSSRRLVPGDVLVLLRGKATCDMVLLTGNCLVEESMLSGEAAHVRKSSFVPAAGTVRAHSYHPDTHHFCTVHAGTYVQQVWNEASSEDEVLAMVVRTGLCTTMGTMLRQVTNPTNRPRLFKDLFLRDLCRFCGFALLLQLCIFCLYISKVHQFQQGPKKVFVRLVDVFIAAVPTGLATVLIFSLGVCVRKLRRQQIDILQPEKIKTIADVEVVCFDKTGTLTGSVLNLHGLLPVVDEEFSPMQRNAFRWPDQLRQAVAVCNSLTLLTKNHVVGDAAEKEAFQAVEAQFLERNLVALPVNCGHRGADQVVTMQVLRRFEFDPALMRSGVVAVDCNDPDTGLVFVRGAPSVVEQLIRGGQVPEDYRQVVDYYSGRSFRLLALAVGVVQGVSCMNLAAASQQQMELRAGSLDVLGLVVLSNHLRSESQETIQHLQEKGSIRTMMVTGDYHHTALAVARGVGMLPLDERVVIIQSRTELMPTNRCSGQLTSALKAPKSPRPSTHTLSGHHKGVSFPVQQQSGEDEAAKGPLRFQLDNGDDFEDGDALRAFTRIAQGQAQCCVTGPAFEHMLHLEDLSVLETVMRNAVVFTRMCSHQKGQVMDLLGGRGLHQVLNGQQRKIPGLKKTCMYCGDGINDLIALGAADVGMAVGSSDASAAAAISNRKASIAGVATVIREARAAQVIKLALVKYMMQYQMLLQLAMNMIFHYNGASLSNVQRGMFDWCALSLGLAASLRPASDTLTPSRPAQVLCKLKHFILIVLLMLISFAMYWGCLAWLTSRPWFNAGSASSRQSPVLSACWCVGLCQIMIPVITFSRDTTPFCKSVSIAEAALFLIYSTFAFLCNLLGPNFFDRAEMFGFYNFPFSYTSWHDLMVWAFLAVYIVVLPYTRKLLDAHEQRKSNKVMPSET